MMIPPSYDNLSAVRERYAVAITKHMANQVNPDDANDPIAKQFKPDLRELSAWDAETPDPIGDYAHSPLKAIVHRHQNRVLLKATHICDVYCRFCFRREMVGHQGDAIRWDDVLGGLAYITKTPSINEVILTGGDPLVLPPAKLKVILETLRQNPAIRFIRFHTRVPVVNPKRISDEFLGLLSRSASTDSSTPQIIFVVHTNHAKEWHPTSIEAVRSLQNLGCMILSQSVLLKGINNTVSALEELVLKLGECGIKPYYLRHPDLARGTSHFRLSFEEGMALVQALRQRVSGYLVPDYVLDSPHGHVKTSINPWSVQSLGRAGHYRITEPTGQSYAYYDPALDPEASTNSSHGITSSQPLAKK